MRTSAPPRAAAGASRKIAARHAEVRLDEMLGETELAGDELKYALVGMGLNVNLDLEAAPEIADIATSVRRELGRDASREELLAVSLNVFEARYSEALKGDTPFRAWRSRLETLGRRVRATLAGRVEEGVAEDVDAEGNLLIRRDDGSLATIEAGDVTLSA